MSEVIVLHADLAGQGDPGREQAMLGRLPYAYRLEIGRRDAAARAASLRALCLLAEGVARLRGAPLDPSQLRFPYGGKPSLDSGPQFSISHSPRRVVVALSEQHELGVDVEEIGAHGRGRAALERWTAVEAALKALGAGLRQSPQVRLSEDAATAEFAGVAVHLRPVPISVDCVAALATRGRVERVRVEEVRGWGIGDGG